MKRRVLLIAMMAVAMCAAAADRFYIEDFSIVAGETRIVNILLDNEIAYTAFQCDIYMPEGLTIDQEDGDYIFDLTNRKARDHNIASQLQHDGAIRVISYSPSIKAYSGNSGALVSFYVTASDDFTGSAILILKNMLFTTTAGVEIPFNDEACNVTIPTSIQMGDVNGDGIINVGDVTALIRRVLGDEVSPFYEEVADITGEGTLNVADVTALISLVLNN